MKVTPKKNIYKNIKGKGKIKKFTKGKIYEDISKKDILEYRLNFYELINDLGEKELIFETSTFQTVSQKRNKILNDLLGD
jgi:hypothetical protein